MKTRSTFSYVINENLQRVEIIDQNRGMSVTNDAENVLTHILEREGDKIKGMKFIYRDSDGIWDTIIPKWNENKCVNVSFKFGY